MKTTRHSAGYVIADEADLQNMRERLAALEDILSTLLEAGRINWTVDDAPIIHGELEAVRALLETEP